MKKWFTKKKIIVCVVIVIIVVLFVTCGKKGSQTTYTEVTAQTRDITTYLEFSGNVEAKDVKNVYAETSAKVLEVLVEEGDKVKKGDVIAILDAGDVEYNIGIKEKALELTKLTNEYNAKDTQTSLDNLNEQIESGLNSSVNNAQNSLLAAQDQYYKAVENYNTAKADYDAEKTSSIVSAKQQLESAKTSLTVNEHNLSPMMSDEDKDYALLSARQAVSQAEENLKTARKNAKQTVDDYYDAMVDAEEALQDAERSYETTMLSVEQNVSQAENSLEKVQALDSTETSEMEIAHLRESLEDYVIYATMDGYITSLNIKEDEYTTKAMAVCEITNLDTMEASVSIDEYDIAQVKTGDPVQIYVNALDTYYEGTISKIAKTATVKNTVSYLDATVEFEANDEITSGLSAEIKLIKTDEKDVLALPVNAISYEKDNTAYVLLKGKDGKEEKRTVLLGVSDAAYVQITDGLEVGDVVYVAPSMDDMYQMMMQQRGEMLGGMGNGGPAR